MQGPAGWGLGAPGCLAHHRDSTLGEGPGREGVTAPKGLEGRRISPGPLRPPTRGGREHAPDTGPQGGRGACPRAAMRGLQGGLTCIRRRRGRPASCSRTRNFTPAARRARPGEGGWSPHCTPRRAAGCGQQPPLQSRPPSAPHQSSGRTAQRPKPRVCRQGRASRLCYSVSRTGVPKSGQGTRWAVGTLLISAPSSMADSGTSHTLACSVGSHAWGSPRWKVLKRRNRS